MTIKVIGEFETTFGTVYEKLSCGHARRKDDNPDREKRETRSGIIAQGADANLPEDGSVYCYKLCHEGLGPRATGDPPLPGAHSQLSSDINDVRPQKGSRPNLNGKS